MSEIESSASELYRVWQESENEYWIIGPQGPISVQKYLKNALYRANRYNLGLNLPNINHNATSNKDILLQAKIIWQERQAQGLIPTELVKVPEPQFANVTITPETLASDSSNPEFSVQAFSDNDDLHKQSDKNALAVEQDYFGVNHNSLVDYDSIKSNIFQAFDDKFEKTSDDKIEKASEKISETEQDYSIWKEKSHEFWLIGPQGPVGHYTEKWRARFVLEKIKTGQARIESHYRRPGYNEKLKEIQKIWQERQKFGIIQQLEPISPKEKATTSVRQDFQNYFEACKSEDASKTEPNKNSKKENYHLEFNLPKNMKTVLKIFENSDLEISIKLEVSKLD